MKKLENILQSSSADTHKTQPYIDTFVSFDEVVAKCFGKKLVSGWEESIDKFRTAYGELRDTEGNPVSKPPKVHIVQDDVPYYCKTKGHGLGYDCEQAVETSHSKLSDFVSNRRIPGFKKPSFNDKLKDAVCAWNSLHM